MAGPVMLARALADGGRVVWDPPERPRLRVTPAWAVLLRNDTGAVRAVLERAVCFRHQIEASRYRPGLPCLILPHAPAPRHGACISCGAPVGHGWRCAPCLVAVYIALEAVPPSDLGPLADPGSPEDRHE